MMLVQLSEKTCDSLSLISIHIKGIFNEIYKCPHVGFRHEYVLLKSLINALKQNDLKYIYTYIFNSPRS